MKQVALLRGALALCMALLALSAFGFVAELGAARTDVCRSTTPAPLKT